MTETKESNMHMAKTESVELCTSERGRKQGGVVIGARVQTEGGIVTHSGVAARYECVLDALLGDKPEKGHLAGTQGSRSDRIAVARSRYEAGMKMRRLFNDAGLVPVRAHDINSRGGDGGEMSDAQASARSRFNDLMRRMGQRGAIASGPCCHDETPNNDRWLSNVRDALDHLCMAVNL